MKRKLLFIAAVTFAAGTTLLAQSVPEINYVGDADFLSLPAYGEVAGVATDSRGNIYVYARTGNPYAEIGGERTFYHSGSRLFQFDASGKFIKEVGQGTYGMDFAQQVRVDPEDNAWTVDAGSNGRDPASRRGSSIRILPYFRRVGAAAGRPNCLPARVFLATLSTGPRTSPGIARATLTWPMASAPTIGSRSSTETGTS
jgi:hypothetical protein